ncbi:apontic [Holotrichia oblita]|uniref:Apontic n=2 Tax=Holotrichia oblita TaxID=644536 RepID=A0ACB9T8M6_HOLOL|nr:guanylate cyclase soluble subunit beta-2 [Holotrichia oblita]KAI4463152.1 apontic [Holotrichia oblita]
MSATAPVTDSSTNNKQIQRITVVNGSAEKIKTLNNFNQQFQIPISYPDFKQYGRQTADLGQEYWLGKKDSSYSKTQFAAAKLLGVKPLVDTISENEKYGNEGGFQRYAATGFVNYIKALSNVINTIVELPFQKTERINRVGNAALDVLGSKIVGL